MAKRTLRQQLTRVDEFLDDRAVGVAILALGRQDAFAVEEGASQGRTFLPSTVQGIAVSIPIGNFVVFGPPEFKVVFAMAGCGMYKTRASVGCHMLAREQRYVELVTDRPRKGCAQISACRFSTRSNPFQHNLRIFFDLLAKLPPIQSIADFARKGSQRHRDFISEYHSRVSRRWHDFPEWSRESLSK